MMIVMTYSCSVSTSFFYSASLLFSDGNSDIENNLNPTQKFLLGDTPQHGKIAVAVGEKTLAVFKKVRFLDFHNI